MPAEKPKPKRKNKPGAGRPKKKLDWKVIEDLASIGCTQEEICHVIECCPATLKNHKADNEKFLAIYKRAKGKFRESIRRQQYNLMLHGGKNGTGCTTAAIWLGKNELGQRDNIDVAMERFVAGLSDEELREQARELLGGDE